MKPIQLLYYPPYHSKYNPVERYWGILERHWNGAKLANAQTMLGWAKSMTWKGVHPVVEFTRKVYEKGISISKKAMQTVEAWLERHPELPQWGILIRPASTVCESSEITVRLCPVFWVHFSWRCRVASGLRVE